jgi:predicted enzyme related to lactoylglutathione lyase
MGSIMHFEIPADDPERAQKFYRELFDWKFEKTAAPTDYWLIETVPPREVGVNGGLVTRQDPGQTVLNYIGVSSAVDTAAKVEELGGEIVMPKTAVPGYGYFVICKDTEGNRFAIWEDDGDAA